MKPLLHHSSSIIIFFFSLAVLMISITNIPICLCENDNIQHTNCNNAFTCESSNITNLRYPYWGGNREKYCGVSGDPNMELVCEGSVPKITINSVKYRILEWDNTTHSLKVARDNYWSGICAANVGGNLENSTFDNTLFQRNGSSQVTLLYNCFEDQQSMVYGITCGDTKVVYTAGDADSASPCVPSFIIVIPILGTQACQVVNSNGFNQALKHGFELTWTGNYGECQRCVDSGGVCGNDGGTQFRCFCKGGSYTTSCSSEKVTASRSKRNRRLIVIGASVAGFGATMFFIIMISCYFKKGISRQQMTIFRKRRKHVDNNVEVFMQSYNLSIARRYSYTEVKRITNSFRDKLGHGGYGVVYKASLTDSIV